MSLVNLPQTGRQLEGTFASICDNFTHDISRFENFIELSRRLLEAGDRRSVVFSLKDILHQISVEPFCRVPAFLLSHEKARVRLRHVQTNVSSVSITSSQVEHSALKVISGGPLTACVFCPDAAIVYRDSSLKYRRVYSGSLEHSFIVLGAGSAAFLESELGAVILEVLSPRILPFYVKVNRYTYHSTRMDFVDEFSAKREVLEAALSAMQKQQ